MAVIEFYQKMDCKTNARQRQQLEKAGHHLVPYDILKQPWSAGQLRRFFSGLPVERWFNPSAPGIKSGAINPKEVTAEQALALMLEDPLLIRRPLIKTNGLAWVGFETERVGSLLSYVVTEDFERCLNPNQRCK